MKMHIDFTKADKSSFDGTGANTYSVDEANALGQHGAKPSVVGSASRKPWNWGKRKPAVDEFGNKWCDCKEPKLVSGDGRGQAFCLLCFAPWYH